MYILKVSTNKCTNIKNTLSHTVHQDFDMFDILYIILMEFYVKKEYMNTYELT